MTRKLLLLPLLALLLPAIASAAPRYVLKHPRREHCRAHYTKKVETVKEHKHHRTVKVRETVCVYAMPKETVVTPAKPVLPTSPAAPARAVKLHAHLDPSFTRDPSDPFKVTYAYSASATSEIVGDAELSEPAPLPEGFLSLYNNGQLACAINVGGATTGGECPITYTTLGTQTIVTTFTSGSTSATETTIEQVEALQGSITLSIAYMPLAHSTLEPGESGCSWEEWADGGNGGSSDGCKRWILGYLEVRGHVSGETGTPPGEPYVSTNVPTCAWTTDSWGCDAGGSETVFTVWATTHLTECGYGTACFGESRDLLAEVGLLNGTETLPSGLHATEAWQAIQKGHLSLAKLNAGDYTARAAYGKTGYSVPEADAQLQFTPTIIE